VWCDSGSVEQNEKQTLSQCQNNSKIKCQMVEGGKTDTNNCHQTSIMYQTQLDIIDLLSV
jgi:hypothetical protein